MTSSAGTSGLISAGSPPMSAIASRIAARSTTAGTPVKSCITTRAGVNAISFDGWAVGSQPASASMSAAVTEPLPSVRNRFSSRIFSENGRRAMSNLEASASRRKMSTVRVPTVSGLRASKLFVDKRFSGGWDRSRHEGDPSQHGRRIPECGSTRTRRVCPLAMTGR